MNKEGHIGLSMLFATPVVLLYPGEVYDQGLWIWICFFIGMSTWPDLDLEFEMKHRGYTHTLLASVVFGIVGALIVLHALPEYTLNAFLGGITGTWSHLVGDLLTFMGFKPLWPLSNKEIALKLFRSSDKRINRLFGKMGALTLAFALVGRGLKWSP